MQFMLAQLLVALIARASAQSTTAGGCDDFIPDCENYGPTACKGQFHTWGQKNCAKYCGFCGLATATPTPPPLAPTKGTCHDSIDNCAAYTKDVCTLTPYTTWVRQNCPLFCGFCKPACEDKVDCSKYAGDVCTSYAKWSSINCAKTCNICQQEHHTTQTTSGGIQVIVGGTLPSQLTGCTYKGHVYKQGENFIDGCDFNCTCIDASRGFYQCRQLCVTWMGLPSVCTLEKAPGKCCEVPNCPPNVVVNYPPNYNPV